MVNEKLAQVVFGVKRTDQKSCVCHNKPQGRESFKDDLSFREFGVSGLCQATQDSVFGADEDDEDDGPRAA